MDDAKVSVFIDDRNVVASRPETIVASKREWFRWSSQVGLVENARKVVVAAASAALTKAVDDYGLAESVKPYDKVLGVCTAAKPRTSTEEERERLGKTLRTLRLLATAQLPFRRYHAAVATYAMIKACYGWFGRRPARAESWKLWAQVRRGDGVCRLANKFIRGILLGGCSHLELLSTRHLLSAVVASDDKSDQRWKRVSWTSGPYPGVLWWTRAGLSLDLGSLTTTLVNALISESGGCPSLRQLTFCVRGGGLTSLPASFCLIGPIGMRLLTGMLWLTGGSSFGRLLLSPPGSGCSLSRRLALLPCLLLRALLGKFQGRRFAVSGMW